MGLILLGLVISSPNLSGMGLSLSYSPFNQECGKSPRAGGQPPMDLGAGWGWACAP